MVGPITGGCQCGAVRYSSAAQPMFAIHCYCRQCQRITGAGHGSQFGLAADAVALSGRVSEYDLTADSGNRVTSGFCATCGSPLLKRSSGYPDLVFFHAASLDDPRAFSAQRNVWLGAKQPWDSVDAALPSDP
jgi:hypothetical protein